MTPKQPPREHVEEILGDWPREPRKLAEDVIEDYGLPDEAAPSRLIWHENGPWKRTELFREGVPHKFPKKHTDYLEQCIDYPIDPKIASDLTRYDGSVMLDRTKGELSARCDREPMNILAINLAHDIAQGRKGIQEARHEHALTAMKAMMGRSPETTQSLQFDAPRTDQGDPGESIVDENLEQEARRRAETA